MKFQGSQLKIPNCLWWNSQAHLFAYCNEVQRLSNQFYTKGTKFQNSLLVCKVQGSSEASPMPRLPIPSNEATTFSIFCRLWWIFCSIQIQIFQLWWSSKASTSLWKVMKLKDPDHSSYPSKRKLKNAG